MPKKYKDIYDQLLKNSRKNGKCLESTFKFHGKRRQYFTHKRKMYSVARAAWEYKKGKIPKGMFVCHHCDNPKCFKLDHLFLGTPSENMQDMIKKKRDNIFGARKYSVSQWKEAEKLRQEGYSCFQISKMTNMKPSAISAHMNRHKIKMGEKKPKERKFPLEIISEVFKLRSKGMKNKDIAKHLKMSICTLERRIREYYRLQKCKG